jgi:hypothetical protein
MEDPLIAESQIGWGNKRYFLWRQRVSLKLGDLECHGDRECQVERSTGLPEPWRRRDLPRAQQKPPAVRGRLPCPWAGSRD